MRTVTSPSIKLTSSKSVRRTFWPLSLFSTTIALNVGTYPSHSAREAVPFIAGGRNLARDFLVRHGSGQAGGLSTMDGTTLDRWVPFWNEGAVVRCRIFCFPHAAGNAAFYRPLRRFLPPEIDLCPLELPGHAARLDELPCTSM